MKTNKILAKVVGMAAIASLAVVFSCQEEDDPFATEASYVAEESVTDTYYEDADDMAGLAMASESGTAGGKVSSEAGILSDDRFLCADLSISFSIESTSLIPIGDIVIDFGNSCQDPRGNVRSGKVKVHFEGRRFLPGSTVTITFENYVINGIILNGTRILTNISESNEALPKFQVQLEGSIKWPDGTEATRQHCFIRAWHRNTLDNLADDELRVTQCGNVDFAATGINRRGIEYRVIILVELVYKRGCPIAVSGKKKFIEVSTGKEIIIDYGTGVCDRLITIEINGRVRTHNVGKR